MEINVGVHRAIAMPEILQHLVKTIHRLLYFAANDLVEQD